MTITAPDRVKNGTLRNLRQARDADKCSPGQGIAGGATVRRPQNRDSALVSNARCAYNGCLIVEAICRMADSILYSLFLFGRPGGRDVCRRVEVLETALVNRNESRVARSTLAACCRAPGRVGHARMMRLGGYVSA